jgi:hypothetical protein
MDGDPMETGEIGFINREATFGDKNINSRLSPGLL